MITVALPLLLLPGCASDEEAHAAAPEPERCEVSLENVEIERAELAWLDRRGPHIDRDLSASRSPEGHLCLEILTDHADPGASAVSFEIVGRQGDREWRLVGEDPSGEPPLLVDAKGCVIVTGEVEVLGADGNAYPYRARMRVRCDRSGD